jgi:hypothetical protein
MRAAGPGVGAIIGRLLEAGLLGYLVLKFSFKLFGYA